MEVKNQKRKRKRSLRNNVIRTTRSTVGEAHGKPNTTCLLTVVEWLEYLQKLEIFDI